MVFGLVFGFEYLQKFKKISIQVEVSEMVRGLKVFPKQNHVSNNYSLK